MFFPAPQATSPPTRTTTSCTVSRTPLSPAQQALSESHYKDAEALFAAQPPSPESSAGHIRAQLGEGKVTEALAEARKAVADHPDDALLAETLGAVQYRHGDLVDATRTYIHAHQLNPCMAIEYYDLSRYENLAGNHASAQRDLNKAHALAPLDPRITRAWESTQRVPLTPEQRRTEIEERIAALDKRIADPTTSGDAKTKAQTGKVAAENSLKALASNQRGDCQLVEPVTTGKIPINGIGNAASAQEAAAAGIDVTLNGKKRRFELDTGASGLLLNRDTARALDLLPEFQVQTGGIGDGGLQNGYISHVDDIRIGNLHFRNCVVRVVDKNSALHVDGLIGSDTFKSYVVTLDMPALEIRLTPLPPRPDQTAEAATLDTEGDDEPGLAGKTYAQSAQDRFVAPSMKDWTPVFRTGHLLILPTFIGKQRNKLFALDTGAQSNLISPAAAREVASVSYDDNIRVSGISGAVKDVFATGPLDLTFAGITVQTPGLIAIALSPNDRGPNVELSGLIGYPTLKQLVIAIDYRDNLVHITYSPHIGGTAR